MKTYLLQITINTAYNDLSITETEALIQIAQATLKKAFKLTNVQAAGVTLSVVEPKSTFQSVRQIKS